MRQDELKDNFLNNGNETRDSLYIENQMEKFKEEHEGDMILNDILLLEEMGYDKKMIKFFSFKIKGNKYDLIFITYII